MTPSIYFSIKTSIFKVKNAARGIEPGAYMIEFVLENISIMGNFSTKQGVLFYPSTIYVEEQEKIDAFLALLDKSGVEKDPDEQELMCQNWGCQESD